MPSSQGYLLAGRDWGVVPNPQFRSQRLDAVGEQTMGHRAVKQGCHNPPVEQAGITLQCRVSEKRGADAFIRLGDETQSETHGI
jgi:hypothetical protein